MNAATQMTIPEFGRETYEVRLDAARRAESAKILRDPRLLALAVADCVFEDALEWGTAFLMAAAYAALNGNPTLQLMLMKAANEAALAVDL